ncbi:flavin-binding monooxygenase-like domain-containing protein [Hirsutella rhossiliensis]|uniref:Flavin-binding monooxygenase-like domain-containing protein n=1 Tax=Hirsutella rhossiliensis TaxID=111463 RepID=A0A9P8MV21_9HYPO|nr:flavin-binding monooxygenase-like domain-containing protein [Hirsutella rhossiliensis]KAH0960959.1 flavin-binding monooxygenase-like domain-containing protein [Hirsutella rhossiliensis]
MTSHAPRGQVGDRVCVIGAGALGLVAIKNLREQGLKVTAFERNEYFGGLWHVSQDPRQVSALVETVMNTSKETTSFTDFPMPDEYPTHPTASQLQSYLEGYVEHFDLLRHIELCTVVSCVRRDDTDNTWLVHLKSTRSGKDDIRQFDRIVVATGMLSSRNQPTVKGIDKFSGEIVHSRELKNPGRFTGNNVLVVGIGSTGADAVCALKRAGVQKLHLSHRSQYCVLPRMFRGRAFDHRLTRRSSTILRSAAALSPRIVSSLMGKIMRLVQNMAFPWLKSHESFLSPRVADGLFHRQPIFSDDLPTCLKGEGVEIFHGIKEVTDARSVTFTDGAEMTNLDAIIFCSGYHYDLSIIQGPGYPADPAYAPDRYERLNSALFYNPQDPFPRLYQGILSERYPESLAVLGHLFAMKPILAFNDLATMALASVWSGNYLLPCAGEMKADIDAHYNFVGLHREGE